MVGYKMRKEGIPNEKAKLFMLASMVLFLTISYSYFCRVNKRNYLG